jgi:hypothetical protein
MKTCSRDYDKVHQIHPDTLMVFGIPIQSRYGCAHEIKEMVSFCCELSIARLTRYIDNIFYDSKSFCCIIYPSKELTLPCCRDALNAINAIARDNIYQFYFYEEIGSDGEVSGIFCFDDDFSTEPEPNAIVK